MTYDQAIQQIEKIVTNLENTEAISVAEYKQKATEVKQLLDFCENEIKDIEKQLL